MSTYWKGARKSFNWDNFGTLFNQSKGTLMAMDFSGNSILGGVWHNHMADSGYHDSGGTHSNA